MKLYRLLTGTDDAAFCKRVSQALNRGWNLHGSPSVSYDPQKGRTICAQAVVKEADGEWSDTMLEDDFKLSQQ
jgi:hypothetical protein